MITDAEYIKRGGNECPRCGSSNLEGSSWDADGRFAWQEVVCCDCEHEWVDTYTLSSIRHYREKED